MSTAYLHIWATYTRLAHISQEPPAFDFPCVNLPEHFHYTGPWRDTRSSQVRFLWEKLTGQPSIYASIGSIQNTKRDLFSAIASACQGLDAQLVITLSSNNHAEALKGLPGSPLVVQNALQIDVISQARLTITHGGLNTILDSLSHGIPLVAIPITYEQPGNGAGIKYTKTGKVIPVNRVNIPRLKAAIQQVLTKDFYLKNAQKIQQSIIPAGGVKRAADIIEQSTQPHFVKQPQTVAVSS